MLGKPNWSPVLGRLGRALGRRGAILLCYGTVWVLYGYGLIVSPPGDRRGLVPLIGVMSLSAWGWLWVASGGCAIVSAWLRQGRDWVGFLALPLMILPWSVSYAMAWVWGIFPRGWFAVLVTVVIIAPVLVVAGWSEPLHTRRERA